MIIIQEAKFCRHKTHHVRDERLKVCFVSCRSICQLESKELNPTLTISLQANECKIFFPLWRHLGRCKYLNLKKKSQQKIRYVRIAMESQKMLCSCTSHPQAHGLHAPVRTSYFLLCTHFRTPVKFYVLLLFSN